MSTVKRSVKTDPSQDTLEIQPQALSSGHASPVATLQREDVLRTLSRLRSLRMRPADSHLAPADSGHADSHPESTIEDPVDTNSPRSSRDKSAADKPAADRHVEDSPGADFLTQLEQCIAELEQLAGGEPSHRLTDSAVPQSNSIDSSPGFGQNPANDYERRIDELQVTLKRFEQDLQDSEARCRDLESDLAAAEKTVRALRHENEKASALQEAQGNKIERLRSECQLLHEQIETLESQMAERLVSERAGSLATGISPDKRIESPVDQDAVREPAPRLDRNPLFEDLELPYSSRLTQDPGSQANPAADAGYVASKYGFLERGEDGYHPEQHSQDESLSGESGEESSFDTQGGDVTSTMESEQAENLNPPTAAPEGDGVVDDEESIEVYMARLMQRVRGESASASISTPTSSYSATSTPVSPLNSGTTPATVANPSSERNGVRAPEVTATPPTVSSNPAATLANEAESGSKNSPGMRRRPDAYQSNLVALREIANDSARKAIATHERHGWLQAAAAKFAASLLAAGAGIIIAHLSRGASWQIAGVACGFTIAIHWAFQAVRMTHSAWLASRRPTASHATEVKHANESPAVPSEPAPNESATA
ncbi:MAG: hypothetical protein RIS70_3891 [Planctomycetota bacterium]